MEYRELVERLLVNGFERVERDDRLLDIFPTETREKGIELWEHWTSNQIFLLRIRLPYGATKLQLFAAPRQEVEQALLTNTVVRLTDHPPRAISTAFNMRSME